MTKTAFSRITTWAIRILLILVVLIGACVFMLSMMGGTSDSHRKGLEQAFSDFLQADVTVNRVGEFNIIPQLSIKAEGIHGVFRETKNEFLLDHFGLAFGFTDLMTGRKKIEDFQLNNFRFSSESKYDFRLDHAGIDPKQSALVATGQYNQRPFSATLLVEKSADVRPVYSITDHGKVSGQYGALQFDGSLVPSSESGPHIMDLDITSSGQKIAKAYTSREGGNFSVVIECNEAVSGKVKSDIESLKELEFIMLRGKCAK